MSAAKLARLIDTERGDVTERLECLRLQVMAWRYTAMIALVDQEKGRQCARWVFANTVPFTDGPAIQSFLTEYAACAKESGIVAGVFQRG